ncbi:hypothetical protein ON010_g10197 [Phytophthora cinnamomi]|nr:hypothetical protein ON010_g10197 [Phytophthora cinnamomi]
MAALKYIRNGNEHVFIHVKKKTKTYLHAADLFLLVVDEAQRQRGPNSEQHDDADRDAEVAGDLVVLHAKVLLRVLLDRDVAHGLRSICHRLATERRAHVLVRLRRLVPGRQLVAVGEHQRDEVGDGELERANVVQPRVARRDRVRRGAEADEHHEDRVEQDADDLGDFFRRHGVREELAQVDKHQHQQRRLEPVHHRRPEPSEAHEPVEDGGEQERADEAVRDLSQRRGNEVPERIVSGITLWNTAIELKNADMKTIPTPEFRPEYDA